MRGFEDVVLIGCGGIGSWLLPLLCKSVGDGTTIHLIDGDTVEEKNVKTQNFFPFDVGSSKVEALSGYVPKECDLRTHECYVGKENVAELIPAYALVFICPDNHACRKTVLEHCYENESKGLSCISAGNEVTDGNAFRTDAGPASFDARERYPEIFATDEGDRSEMSCADLAVQDSGGVNAGTNAMSAMAAYRLAMAFDRPLACALEPLAEILFDMKTVKMRGSYNRVQDGKTVLSPEPPPTVSLDDFAALPITPRRAATVLAEVITGAHADTLLTDEITIPYDGTPITTEEGGQDVEENDEA